MAHFSRSCSIQATPDVVFGILADFQHLPEIWPSVIEVRNLEMRPNGIGSRYDWVYKMAGHRFEGHSEVVGWSPGSRLEVRDRGGIEATRDMHVEPMGTETRCTVTVEYSVPIPLVGRLAEAFVLRQNEHEAEAFLANLKARAES